MAEERGERQHYCPSALRQTAIIMIAGTAHSAASCWCGGACGELCTPLILTACVDGFGASDAQIVQLALPIFRNILH